MDDLPLRGGIYSLLLKATHPNVIEVGKLGVFEIPAGIYAYQGSAQGPGGLSSRLGHHFRHLARPHWHIDYLRMRTEVVGYVCYILRDKNIGNLRAECAWNQALLELDGATAPVPGFGASDCKSGCVAHLIHISVTTDVDHQLRMMLIDRITFGFKMHDRSTKNVVACVFF